MSDDDEIIFETSDLYKHLIDQGYCDFTSLGSNYYVDVSNNLETNNGVNNQTKKLQHANSFSISDHNKLLNILNSQLLFKEDVDVLETILSSLCVYKSNSSLYSYVSVGIGGLFLSLVPLIRPKFRCIPIGITVLCSTFSTWLFYLRILESRENTVFASHVSLLQKLCSNIHRVFRCLKETEIISTGQVSTDNIGIAAYSRLPVGLGFHNSKELDTLPSWKTLPQVRISLMNVLIVTIKLLNEASEAIRFAINSKRIMKDCLSAESLEYKNTLETLAEMLNANHCISLKSLQYVNDIYLAVQSEYLKWIALYIFDMSDITSTRSILSQRKSLFKVISYLQSKLGIIPLNLISQFHTHNNSAFTKTYHGHKKPNVGNKTPNFLIEIHNLSLLVLSILLRVRSLEDSLAELSETNAHTKLNKDINKQLNSLKDDLMCTVKCYDLIYSQLFPKDNVVLQPEEKCNKNIVDQRSKETGVVVGASDFNVNSPDEVFLAMSGDNNEDRDRFIDDWLFESKPQIPKNLLEELNKTLKSRKIQFSEREKLALERQGLHDIQDSLESSSDEDNWKVETNKGKTINKKMLQLENSGASDSENYNNSAIMKKHIRREQTSFNKHDADSTSDSDTSFSDRATFNLVTTPKQCKNNVDNLSLAKMIALKSQMWKKSEEDNFSDG